MTHPLHPRPAPRQRSQLAAVLVALVLAASAATLAGCGEAFPTQGVCEVDGDCQPGLTCHDARLCVSASQTSHAVVLRLAPPPGQGLVLEHFDASIGGNLSSQGSTWQLTTPAAVRGTVVRALDTFHSSISGTLIATAPGKISGTTIRYDTMSHSTPRTFEGSDGLHGFELLLQIGPTYALTFWPHSDQIPPYYTELKVGGDTDHWTLKLPADKDLLTISGRLISRATTQDACDDGKPTPCAKCDPLVGVRVMLVDAKSRVRSSRTVTDATGAFELSADPTGGPVQLRFEPANGGATLPHGVHRAVIDLPALRKKALQKLDLGDLDIGPRGAPAPRKLLVVDAAGQPVAGATVEVTAQLVSPPSCETIKGKAPLLRFSTLQLRLSQPTNANGEVTFMLPAGAAHISVVPSVAHHVGRWQKDNVTLDDSPITISCPDRAVQRGRLEDFKKQAVIGAQVQFLPLGDLARTPVSTVSDAEGRFSAPLDVGRWAVTVEPPTDSGLGRDSRHTLEIEAGQEPLPLDMTLPPPAVMVGRVLDHSGTALAGVLVDVMANKLQSLSGRGNGANPRENQALLLMGTHLLATTITGADGRFEVLIETSQLSE